MVYTQDSSLWREEGPKALLEFLSTAEGEQHDAAVYDTKCEFDRHDPNAIRYIACLAMTKASFGKEEFSYELPENGTVAPIGAPIGTEDMLKSAAYRAERERITSEAADESRFNSVADRIDAHLRAAIYVPNADDYVQRVVDGTKKRNIPLDDMTPSERSSYEQSHTPDPLGTALCWVSAIGYGLWEMWKPFIIFGAVLSAIWLLLKLAS